MDRVGAWLRGSMGGVGQSLARLALVAWVRKILGVDGVGCMGQKNEVQQKMALV